MLYVEYLIHHFAQYIEKMTESHPNAFHTALEAAAEELCAVEAEVEQLRTRLQICEQKSGSIRKLIEELIQHVPSTEWPASLFDELGYNRSIQLQLDIGSPAYSQMLKIVFGMRDQLWTADTLEEALRKKGQYVSRKFISNTFARLAAKGAIQKIGRGHYKVLEDRDIELTKDTILISPRRELRKSEYEI